MFALPAAFAGSSPVLEGSLETDPTVDECKLVTLDPLAPEN